MHINFVEVKNFRNYSHEKFLLNKNVNILLGDNAQGKTNLLEGIYFSCIGKSFKTKNEQDLIKHNENSLKILVDFEKNNGHNTIEVQFRGKDKFIKLNEVSLTKSSGLLGNLACVFFSPNELKLVKEAPEDRRKFLDIALSQLSKEYYINLLKYNKILKQRNKLLKSSDNEKIIKETLPIWSFQLARPASEIIFYRLNFIKKLNMLAQKEHQYLSSEKENLSLAYSSCHNFGETSATEIEQILLEKYKQNEDKDISLGYTTVGPHRDDLKIFLNDLDVKSFASQGQQRTCLLSIKLAETEIFNLFFKEYPILLLDDVFSELDEKRKEKLFKRTQKFQTLVTTTKFDMVDSNAKIIKIENGKIVL